jgi:hypothetical protein
MYEVTEISKRRFRRDGPAHWQLRVCFSTEPRSGLLHLKKPGWVHGCHTELTIRQGRGCWTDVSGATWPPQRGEQLTDGVICHWPYLCTIIIVFYSHLSRWWYDLQLRQPSHPQIQRVEQNSGSAKQSINRNQGPSNESGLVRLYSY